MPEKLKIINGALVLTLAYDTYVGYKNKAKYKKLQELTNLLALELYSANHVNEYLVSKLNEHEIPMTEFDIIAMNNPM